MSLPPPSIFSARPDMDPFYVYRADFDDDDDALDEISGGDPGFKARLQQMVMDQRDRFYERIMAKDNEEDEFEREAERTEVIESVSREGNEKSPVRAKAAKKKVSGPQSPPKSAKQAPSSNQFSLPKLSNREKVTSCLKQISASFSRVFQALLVLLENPSSHVANSPLEAERASKRSREFDSRLSRMSFELKQKICQVRASSVKLSLHPRDVSLRDSAEGKLYQALRCVQSILKSYISHLPLSGTNIYPHSLDSAVGEFEAMAKLCLDLGFDASEFLTDTQRLKVAAEKSRSKVEAKQQMAEKQQQTNEEEKRKKREFALNMIDNLAREKFGTSMPAPSHASSSPPKSPKKTNLRKNQKVIIPKGTRLHHDRTAFSRSRILGSGGGDQSWPVEDDVRKGNTTRSKVSSRDLRRSPPPIFVDHETTTSVGDHFANTTAAGRELHLEIGDEVASRIFNQPRGLQLPAFSAGYDPYEIVGSVTASVLDELVEKVCIDMLNEDIVAKMLEDELKG